MMTNENMPIKNWKYIILYLKKEDIKGGKIMRRYKNQTTGGREIWIYIYDQRKAEF